MLIKNDNLEVREYRPTFVAQAMVEGERDKAIQRGLGIIADYIFGNGSADSVNGLSCSNSTRLIIGNHAQ